MPKKMFFNFWLEQLRFFSFDVASTRMSLLETTSRHGSHSALFGNDRTRMVFFLFNCLTNYYDAFLLFWIRFYFPLSIYIYIHRLYYLFDCLEFFFFLPLLIMNFFFFSVFQKIPMNMCVYIRYICVVSNKLLINNGKNVDLIHAVKFADSFVK